jgi:hypothetical protein
MVDIGAQGLAIEDAAAAHARPSMNVNKEPQVRLQH